MIDLEENSGVDSTFMYELPEFQSSNPILSEHRSHSHGDVLNPNRYPMNSLSSFSKTQPNRTFQNRFFPNTSIPQMEVRHMESTIPTSTASRIMLNRSLLGNDGCAVDINRKVMKLKNDPVVFLCETCHKYSITNVTRSKNIQWIYVICCILFFVDMLISFYLFSLKNPPMGLVTFFTTISVVFVVSIFILLVTYIWGNTCNHSCAVCGSYFGTNRTKALIVCE